MIYLHFLYFAYLYFGAYYVLEKSRLINLKKIVQILLLTFLENGWLNRVGAKAIHWFNVLIFPYFTFIKNLLYSFHLKNLLFRLGIKIIAILMLEGL